MPKKQPQLAKLTRPRLYKAVARERLFQLLDEKREHPVVWIVGPPGAGKTTLAASYLEEAGVPAIWYQIDPGDSDPATFFFYLKQAIEAVAKRKAKPLPLLTPEYLPDLPGFARRFLRDGFARLPDEAILVFDNYHDIAANSTLHAPFMAALAEVPQGSNIIVLSRAAPPPGFAGALVNQTIALVSWEDLRLTAEETTAIAASRGITDRNILRTLHEQSTGWIAGVTLMLERLRGGGSLESLQGAEALDTVFDYFAGLIFDNASEEMREVLMKTAFLPRMSAVLAEAVTGKSNAIAHIEDLHRRHLFTDRSVGGEITYQYHALFRAFLRSKASIEFSPDACRSIARRAAAELQTQGQADLAFALFVEAEEWDSAEKIFMVLAPQLLAQGRWQTLGQWVDVLPREHLETNPWVQYWLGRSRIFVDPVAVRPLIEAAYRMFLDRGDQIGQLLCATTILEGIYFEFDDIKPMDPWIDRIVALLQEGVLPSSKEDELRVHSAVMMGATFRAPRHSMLESCLRRVVELLKEPFDPNIKVAAASMLHAYSNLAMDTAVQQMAILVAHPLIESEQVPGPRAIFYWSAEGYTHYLRGRYAQSLACFDAADKIIHENGYSEGYWGSVGFRRGLVQRRAGLLDQAEATIRRIEGQATPAAGLEAGGLDLLKAGVSFDRGDIHSAIESIVKSYRAFERSGHFNGVMLVGLVAANMAIAGDRFELAAQILSQLRGKEYGPIAENYLAPIVLNQAWLANRLGDIAARNNLLGDAMRRSHDERGRARLRWYHNAMAELLPIALSEGIETDVVYSLAREFSVVPEPLDIENWPWQVRIHTLGRFELLIDGESPGYSRKIPKKVLALLKAIVAFGANNVPEQKLLDALWPSDEGDAARQSLTATLHRLRKLLMNGNAIRQTGGELTLDNTYCWVDSISFESRLDRGGDDGEAGNSPIPLYRGAFLAQDEDATWAVPMRARLQTKFIQAVGKQCASLEAGRRYEQAIDLYLRGIEADSLVEPFYQGLMRCYDRLNRRTEAVSAYRRLRQTLSVSLGVQPSGATQRLFETLRLN
jgi:LuxR family maltose regulon positive regulatory protein